jgi:quinol monooxygenase YgiN
MLTKYLATLLVTLTLTLTHPTPAQTPTPMVRIAEIQIDPAHLDAYKAALKLEIEASIRLEPGVLTLYAVSLKDHPTEIRLFETYADQAAYNAHLQSPHFKTYKAATQGMILSLKLLETDPILLRARPAAEPTPTPAPTPTVRLLELELDPLHLDAYKAALQQVIEASIPLEPGVIALYAVSLKDHPTQLRLLEIYADPAAYAAHLQSPHYKKYKAATQGMVLSRNVLEADPILLGAIRP